MRKASVQIVATFRGQEEPVARSKLGVGSQERDTGRQQVWSATMIGDESAACDYRKFVNAALLCLLVVTEFIPVARC